LGRHTLRVESNRLRISGSLSIAIQPGQNWVVLNPQNAEVRGRSEWRLLMEQHKKRPGYL
jgi:hypothetical protein